MSMGGVSLIFVPSLLFLLVCLVQLQCYSFVLSYFVKKEKQSWSVASVPQLVFVPRQKHTALRN